MITEITEKLENEVFDFLDNLRSSGDTNMFGARSYILESFPKISNFQAGKLLTKWMKTFGERHPEGVPA